MQSKLTFFTFCVHLFIFINTIASQGDEVTQIQTTYGPIEGTRMKEGKVTAFLGVPYAQAPLGILRFEKAVKPEPWTEPKKTKHWLRKCLPFRRKFESLENYNEDCLYLNLLLPTETASKTNLLLIFSNEELNVIKILNNLVKREVAVGVVYFRQGLQGFASLADQGDYGISDMKLALTFINENLQRYNIDGSITVAAENDGSSALHGAFADWIQEHKVDKGRYRLILLNGHALVQSNQADDERTTKNTKLLFKQIDCDLPSASQALDCARTKSFTELLKAYLNLDYLEEYGAPFRTRIDRNDVSKESQVDMIVGVQSTVSQDHYRTVDEFNTNYTYQDFKLTMARVISDKKFNNGPLIRRLVFHEYINSVGDKKDTYFLWQQARRILQDKHFNEPTARLVKNLDSTASNIFLFKYDVPKPFSTCLSAFSPEYLQDFCQQWTQFVLRFSTKGAPTQKSCGEDKPKWPALGSTKRDYHVIMHDNGKLEWDFPFELKADAFWNELVHVFDGLELAGKRYPTNENDIELVHPLQEEDDVQQYHTAVHKDEF